MSQFELSDKLDIAICLPDVVEIFVGKNARFIPKLITRDPLEVYVFRYMKNSNSDFT